MIEDKSVLGIIAARGESKGLPGKNVRSLQGKPLIAWTIEAAKPSRFIDRLILSSEDAEIIEAAKRYGCEVPFVRPRELATDQSSIIDAIRHALETLPETYDYLVLLQPTSPLRTTEDIDNCLALCHEKGAPAAVSVVAADKPPQWMYQVDDDSRLCPVIPVKSDVFRRQDLPPVYLLNGAVYVSRCDRIKDQNDFISPETVAYEMPKNRSADIDSELDFMWVNALLGE